MPDIAFTILSAICALFIVIALFSDPSSDDQLGLPAIGTLIMIPIIALIIAGIAFALPLILSALGILTLVLIGLALLFLLWRIVTSNEFGSLIKKIFPNILKFLKAIPKVLANIFKPIWKSIKALSKALWKILKSPLKALRALLKTLSNLPGFLGRIFKGIGNIFGALFDAVRAVFNGIFGLIKDVLSFIYNMLWDAAPWMRPILKFLLWFLLIPLLLFRRRKDDDEKEDGKEKKRKIRKSRGPFFIKGSKKSKKEYVPVALVKQVPTVIQGASKDLLHVLSSTHKRIRNIEQR
ncbi:MAG: hypothetical protein O3A80_02550 [bacterium]|nr:hypothetical protein [bacterium]